MAKSCVVIKDAPKLDYLKDFVALPDDYGKYDYFQRPDIKAIRETVFASLDELNAKTSFTDELKNNRRVIIKPNLVNVYHNAGFKEKDYPETTDPRVFEAVVGYIKQYTNNIVIAESSGKPFPAAASFVITGYDRIAEYYNTELCPLEREPVVRYMLPKAEVMKEILIPQLFDEIVKGEAYYISVPKMKTNLYTGVTLGFKNAMGTIPYFLRERNHTYLINKKLADMLYLFKPNLTVIDGIIGGEGNTPAPVDPVDVGMIVASNQSVEADRITTYMMGFDPSKNKLLIEADRRGFGDPNVEIVGTPRVVPFKPACQSLMRGEIHDKFPGILALAGHTLNDAPTVTDKNAVTPDIAFQLEQACVGGCLASVAMGFACNDYAPHSNHDVKVAIIMGSGVPINSERYWFDRDGNPYTKQEIIDLPIKKMTMGKCCGDDMQEIATFKIDRCCDPAQCLSATSNACGQITAQLNPLKNTTLIPVAVPKMLGTIAARVKWTALGRAVDVPRMHEDKIFPIPELSPTDAKKDYIEWPIPPLSLKERGRAIADLLNLAESLTGMLTTVKYYIPEKK